MSFMTRRAVLAASLGGVLLPAAETFAQTSAPAPAAPAAKAGPTAAPPGAVVYIIWPKDGDRVKGAFWCRFGLRNMGVTRSGDAAPNSGHHHLLVDVDEAPKPGQLIPQDKQHLHFGGGQTETRLTLPPGEHTLQLVLGDALHKVFNPPLISKKIRIVVN